MLRSFVIEQTLVMNLTTEKKLSWSRS